MCTDFISRTLQNSVTRNELFSRVFLFPATNRSISFCPVVALCFHFLMSLANSYRTILNRSSEGGHPYLVQDHSGNASNVSPLNVMLALIVLRNVLSTHSFLKAFFPLYHGKLLHFIKGLLYTYRDNPVVFIIYLVNMMCNSC